MSDAQLEQEMKGLNFYHTIALTPTLSTPGWPTVVPIVEMTRRVMQQIDFRGKRVLDIGCRDGLFCFEAEKLGASEVIGIDNDLATGVPEFLIRTLRSNVRIKSLNLFDLRPESFGLFDVVIFPGVLYHLRHPFWALKLVQDVMVDGATLVLETALLADVNKHAILYCPTGAESPYNDPTSVTFFNRKGLLDTLTSMGFEVAAFECLLNLRGNPGGIPDKPLIDRCVTTCRKSAAASRDEINRYWEGTPYAHNIPLWNDQRRSA